MEQRTSGGSLRRAAKRDANERPIIEALRRIGASVVVMKEPVDLLVGFRGRTVALEVKDIGGTLTEAQKDFFARFCGEAYVVQNVQQAMQAVLGAEAMK